MGTKDKLLNEALTGGLSDEAPSKGKKAPSKGYTMSIYIGPTRKSRIERLQQEWGLNASETVRLLIDHALAEVERGRLKPKMEAVTKAQAPAP